MIRFEFETISCVLSDVCVLLGDVLGRRQQGQRDNFRAQLIEASGLGLAQFALQG